MERPRSWTYPDGRGGRTTQTDRREWAHAQPARLGAHREREEALQGLEEVAQQVGTKSIQAVAIAYVMQKTPYVFPIIGCRKIEQLQANIEALDVSLSPEQIKYLESILPFEPGFPHGMVVGVFVDVHVCSWCKRAHVSLCRATDRSTSA